MFQTRSSMTPKVARAAGQEPLNIRVRIVDREHPHYPETGVLTGKIVTFPWGEKMAEMKLDACAHGEDGCYVSPGQVKELEHTRSLRAR